MRKRARKEAAGGSDGVAPASAVRDEASAAVDPAESGSEKAAEATHAEGVRFCSCLVCIVRLVFRQLLERQLRDLLMQTGIRAGLHVYTHVCTLA